MRAPRVQYIKPFYYPYRPPWIVIPINITLDGDGINMEIIEILNPTFVKGGGH